MPTPLKTWVTDLRAVPHAPWLFVTLARHNQIGCDDRVNSQARKGTMNAKRMILIWCLVGLGLLVTIAAVAQVAQEEKKSLAVQTSTQNQFSYQKMILCQELTQQMAQNQYTYQQKNQNKTSNQKKIQGANTSGSGDSGQQGQQSSQSGDARGGN